MPLPIKASAALRTQTPQKKFISVNRYDVLREPSPEPIGRARAGSVKRKVPEGPSFAEITSGVVMQESVCIDPSDLTLEVATVSSVVEKAAKEINDAELDPVTVTVFGYICEAMRGICRVQDKIVSAALQNKVQASVPVPALATANRGPAPEMVSLGATAKRPRAGVTTAQPVPIVTVSDTEVRSLPPV
jgi:hypothetical protein